MGGLGAGPERSPEPPPAVVKQLQAHVDAILAAARTPSTFRSELAEELYGHLVQRWAELVADGAAPDEAARLAIQSFGRADQVGPEFMRSFHGRMWASTIGVLFPSDAPVDRARPALILWLRLGVAYEALGMLVGGILVLAFSPPVHALVAGLPALVTVGLLVATYIGIGQGRRWALAVAIVAFVADVVVSVVIAHLVSPWSTVVALALLIAIASTRPDRSAWFAGPSRPGWAGTVGLAAIVVASNAAFALSPAIPDPTEVTAADLQLQLDVACGPPGDLVATQIATATVRVTWARHDSLPTGVLGHLLGSDAPDAIVLSASPAADRATDPGAPDPWAIIVAPTDQPWFHPGFMEGIETGITLTLLTPETQFTGGSASVFTHPSSAGGPKEYASRVSPAAMTIGDAYTTMWTFAQQGPVPILGPRVTARYVHDYRFAQEASATCGETAIGHAAP